MIRAVYPGTFDPITNGHIDVARRASRLFDEVIVAIAHNINKRTFFNIEERQALARQALADIPNVSVQVVPGLLVDFAKRHEVQVILRGLRAVSDFEFEYQLAGMNRHLEPDIETLFLRPAEEYAYISSSLVKEVARLGGDIGKFLHPAVHAALTAKLAAGG